MEKTFKILINLNTIKEYYNHNIIIYNLIIIQSIFFFKIR